jgi:type IV pilus assembly protein PilC
MPAFAWKGKNRNGEAQDGVVVADSKDLALKMLQRNGIKVTTIQAQAAKSGRGFGGKVKPKTLAIFTRQFSVMIDAGLPLVQCLEILSAQQEDKNFKSIIEEIRQDVEQGATLQAALAKHPKAFNDLYVNMVGAGEVGGILDVILQRLSTYIEKAVKLTGKVKGAMTYPIAVISIAGIVVYVIMVKVIPVFSQVYEGAGGLPAPTKLCIVISDILLNYGWMVGLGIFGFFVLYRQYYKTQGGKLQIDAMYLKMPVLGDILRKVAVARFCRTLGTLVSSGVPILEGMDITARTAGNQVVQNAITHCRDAVEKGRNIAGPLAETKVFPPMVVQMVGVGEATGALDAMLAKVADFYDDEVDNAVAALTALMEPLIIALLGGIIGFIVVSMYMPIFNMGQVMGD